MSEEALTRLVLAAAMVGSGVLLIWVAGAAASGRLRRNPTAGIRLASTMSSDEAWSAAHQRARRPTQVAGWCAIASAVPTVLPVSLPVVVGVILAGTAVMLALVLYGAAVGHSAAAAVRGDEGDEG